MGVMIMLQVIVTYKNYREETLKARLERNHCVLSQEFLLSEFDHMRLPFVISNVVSIIENKNQSIITV